jgi:hypothetical protein
MARATTVKLEIENIEEFIRNLEAKQQDVERGAQVALRDEARQILDRSQILVPVDTGRLRDSGFVGIVGRWARGWEIKFGYGAPYALYQHFGNYEHDDGRKGYLEDPVKYSRKGLVDRLRSVIARYL